MGGMRFKSGGPPRDRGQVITLIEPRPGGSGALKDVRPLPGAEGVSGFETVDEKGEAIRYLSAAEGVANLDLGLVKARAESLLLYGGAGRAGRHGMVRQWEVRQVACCGF